MFFSSSSTEFMIFLNSGGGVKRGWRWCGLGWGVLGGGIENCLIGLFNLCVPGTEYINTKELFWALI